MTVSLLYLHQDVEGARTGVVRTGEEIVEVDAVSVILLHDWQLKPGLLPHIILRNVHIHVGTWTQRQGRIYLSLDLLKSRLCAHCMHYMRLHE